ncbi:MAG: CRISPR-associated protein Csd1 [Clostridiales bacterium]|jgi:CRISPR-associated protein Csd1|nr:CRISPR-associated protein Csd1 [Clostridiales bacterium]
MLYELAQYAIKNHLNAEGGFKVKEALWTIALSDKGEFIDVIKEKRSFPMCPNLEQNELIAGGVTRSHFLLDSLESILQMDVDKSAQNKAKNASTEDSEIVKKKYIEKVGQKHNFFIELLEQASAYEPLLSPCINFLKDENEVAKAVARLSGLKAKPGDSATFRIGGIYPVELDSWHEWWREFRASLNNKGEAPKMVCFLSGKVAEPIYNHFKITGLQDVGGQSSGTSLISFDKDSFSSFGLRQSLNAACSQDSAALYSSALNDLIKKAPRPFAGVKFLHWYKEPIPAEDDILLFGDDLSGMEEASAKLKVERLFSSIVEGKRPEFMRNKYYILQLSGSGGRVMVRDWLCGDFSDMVINMRKWFDDLSIISSDGNGLANDFKLSAALIRLVGYRPKERSGDTFKRIDNELSSSIVKLWRSILEGSALTRSVPERALRYIRSKVLNAETENDINLDRIACALLKAWLIREDSKGGVDYMKPELNKEHPSPAYHTGRLMAVLASLQQSALGDVGAGVIQRYYSAASTTPALVMGRLIRLSQYHLAKLESKGLVVWYENQMADIMARIGDNIPATLTLEEQALFALGYYQQKAAMMANRSKSQENIL